MHLLHPRRDPVRFISFNYLIQFQQINVSLIAYLLYKYKQVRLLTHQRGFLKIHRGRRLLLTQTGLAVNSLDAHQGRVYSPKVLTNCTVPNDSVNDLFPALRYIVLLLSFLARAFSCWRDIWFSSQTD